MRIVIDAQLVCGFFREEARSEEPVYTASMRSVIAELGRVDIGYIDNDGHLEQEYRQSVDPEWFDAWFGERLEVGDFVSVSATKCTQLIRKLANDFGFPPNGRDRRYVALAKTVAEANEADVAVLSEDLHFYSPREKQAGSKRRATILRTQGGPVARYLRKREGILVRSVAGHLEARAA